MRSAVSVILSSPARESAMSHPDYRQTCHDHATLLILVRHLGSRLSSRTFSRFYERISRQTVFKIRDGTGNLRTIHTRYVRVYPVESNDWGDFQSHRRVLGLISVGQCSSTQEISELCRIHESLRVKYNSTLFDSRCVLLGLQQDGTPYVHSNLPTPTANGTEEIPVFDNTSETSSFSNGSTSSTATDAKYHHTHVEMKDLTEVFANDDDVTKTTPGLKKRGSLSDLESLCDFTPSKMGHPTRTLFYPSLEKCSSLESDLQDFVSSLFWVLESKRLVALGNMEKEKQPLLCAPFERKDLIGVDLDSRTHRKRSVGRWRKHLGDLCLQAGLIAEALEHYYSAAETLKPVNDWLWLAGACEGLAAASVLLLYPQLRRPAALQRIGSLTGEGLLQRKAGSGSTAPRSLPNDLDIASALFSKSKIRFCLTSGEVVEKFHDAVVHYSKYRNAGVIETEASIKAVHVLIEQRRYLVAAEFLQNVVFINLQLSDEEKVQRFTALSELYAEMGFERKSSFFRRVAAMRCIAPQTSMQADWSLCYQLLHESLPGFRLSLDPSRYALKTASGWPVLQVQLLQELIGTARRLGNQALGIRHAALLLHLLHLQHQQGSFPALTNAEQCELARQIDLLTQRCQVAIGPGPLVLDNGTIVPPVPLALLPKVSGVKLLQPPAYYKPQKLQSTSTEETSGPFLFTPIQFGSFRKHLNTKTQIKMDFEWVEGDQCYVTLQVANTAPFELKITQMSLITEGIDFESTPAAVTLAPAAENDSAALVRLTGVARSCGQLKITGYATTILGLRSHCKFKNLLRPLNVPHYIVDVVPALPRVDVQVSHTSMSSSSSEESGSVIASSFIQLYAGQSTECSLTIINNSTVAVETLDVELVWPGKNSSEIFSFSTENLKSQLPLQPGAAASITIYIYGAADFLLPAPSSGALTTVASAGGCSDDLTSLSGPPSSLSRFSSHNVAARNKARRAESLLSVRSGTPSLRSVGSEQRAIEVCSSLATSPAKIVEATLKIQYSGGPGLKAGYSRTSSVAISLEILPSLLVSKWDVLAAETPSHCYLVLDVLNAAAHEMELHYSNKHLAIESSESCRIPVPVERCPLAKLKHVYTSEDATVSCEQQQAEIARICCEHLASLVDLKWKMCTNPCSSPPESDVTSDNASLHTITGKVSLNGLRCSATMLDLLHVSPIQFEVRINEDLWSSDKGELSFTVGEVLNMGISLYNALDTPLGPLKLQVSAYQDLQNGTWNKRLDTRLLIIGSDSMTVTEAGAQQRFSHVCGVAFFTPGVYKIDVLCSLLGKTEEPTTKAFHLLDSGRHVWKLSPAIEVSIKEQ